VQLDPDHGFLDRLQRDGARVEAPLGTSPTATKHAIKPLIRQRQRDGSFIVAPSKRSRMIITIFSSISQDPSSALGLLTAESAFACRQT
jgi:hypothetical protein